MRQCNGMSLCLVLKWIGTNIAFQPCSIIIHNFVIFQKNGHWKIDLEFILMFFTLKNTVTEESSLCPSLEAQALQKDLLILCFLVKKTMQMMRTMLILKWT